MATTATRKEAPAPASTPRERRDLKIALPEFTHFSLRLHGTSPLIVDAFSEDAKRKLAASQDGSPKQKPGPRDPAREFENSQYHREDGTYGVPKLAFRKAFQSAAIRMSEVKGTEMLAAFQIDTPDEMLPLEADAPTMRTDHVVRVGRGNLAYRAEFYPWAVTIPLKLDESVVSLDQFVDIAARAGMGVGIGNWRPEKKGDFGTWEIVGLENVKVYGGSL
jgi:hypothetical protein